MVTEQLRLTGMLATVAAVAVARASAPAAEKPAHYGALDLAGGDVRQRAAARVDPGLQPIGGTGDRVISQPGGDEIGRTDAPAPVSRHASGFTPRRCSSGRSTMPAGKGIHSKIRLAA
jgi:hypothetical protein